MPEHAGFIKHCMRTLTLFAEDTLNKVTGDRCIQNVPSWLIYIE